MAQKKPSVCFVGMNTLQVLTPEFSHLTVGGAELQQVLLAKALKQRGFDVSLAVYDWGQKDGQAWDGIVTHKAYNRDEGIRYLRSIHPRFTSIWRALKRADADIYHVTVRGSLIAMVALFTKLHNRKLVYRVSSDVECQTDPHEARRRGSRSLYEFGLRSADLITVQNQFQYDAMDRACDGTPFLTKSLLNVPEIDLDYADRDVAVLWVGNMRKIKRPHLFIEAARSMPDIGFHMVGGALNRARDYYADIKRQSETAANLSFHGLVPYHDANAIYDRARVYVNTSEREGFPNTYLQSWIRGIPVVTFFDPDGVIEREGLGKTVTSVDEMNRAIRTFATDEAEWRAAHRRCKEYMKREYDQSKLIDRYVLAFNDLIGRDGGLQGRVEHPTPLDMSPAS